MSMADAKGLRRFVEVTKASPLPDPQGTAAFYRAGRSRGANWFSLYLAESLSERFSAEDRDAFRWLILHMAMQADAGHIRSDLDNLASEMTLWFLDQEGQAPEGCSADWPRTLAQSLPRLLEIPGAWGLLTSVDSPADSLEKPRPPMVLTHDRRYAYFLRRRKLEDRFLQLLGSLVSSPLPEPVILAAAQDLSPQVRSLVAILRTGGRFAILAGGPGTGKTTTVANLIRHIGADGVGLAAPTGRAATRLAEGLGGLLEAKTIHALLGLRPGGEAKHHTDNPLDLKLLVVDEASMVDLPLMIKLFEALGPQTSLLLVGDPDQLPSVESGAILGDLLAGEASGGGPLAGLVVRLTTVFRSNTEILDAAGAVMAGDSQALRTAFRPQENPTGVIFGPLGRPDQFAAAVASSYGRGLRSRNLSEDLDQARHDIEPWFEAMNAHVVLSPNRLGPWGVEALNARIAAQLGRGESIFPGMPITVTRNDASRDLWNGDRGLLLELGSKLRAIFTDSAGGYRSLPLAAIPAWEPAWVQTVHKSQGSEYDQVTALLPQGSGRLLSREILYTALTRARRKVRLLGEDRALDMALNVRVSRNSRIRRWAEGA